MQSPMLRGILWPVISSATGELKSIRREWDMVGGRWYGTGIVMGSSTEHGQGATKHLHHASETEHAVAHSDGRELLGIKDLTADGHNLLGSQYVDLTHQSGPPNPADAADNCEQVAESADTWHEENGVLIRTGNKLRVGKLMPDLNDPFIAGRPLEDWRFLSWWTSHGL